MWFKLGVVHIGLPKQPGFEPGGFAPPGGLSLRRSRPSDAQQSALFQRGPSPRPGLEALTRAGLGQSRHEVALLLGSKKVRNAPADAEPGRLVRVVFWNLGNHRHPEAMDRWRAQKDGNGTCSEPSRTERAELKKKADGLVEGLLIAGKDRPPDFAFVAEIENQAVAQQLADHPKLRAAGYHVVAPQLDSFPMTNGILSRYPLVGAPKLHQVHGEEDMPTRGVLEATFDVDGHALTVFVNHWPSKRGGDEAEAQRQDVANQVKQMVRERQALNPNADILVVGDFNAHLEDDVFSREYLHAVTDPTAALDDRSGDTLFHTVADVAEKALGRRPHSLEELGDLEREEGLDIGTHVFKGTWRTLDGIIANRGLLDGKGLDYVPGSAEVIRDPRLLYKGRKPDREKSDHLPVAATLEVMGSADAAPDALSLRASKRKLRKPPPQVQLGRSNFGLPFPPLSADAVAHLSGSEQADALRAAFQTRMQLSPQGLRDLWRGQPPSVTPLPFGNKASTKEAVFEPAEAHKADVAKAMLAAQALGSVELSPSEEETLLAWAAPHGQDPSRDLFTRRSALRQVQSGMNPFLALPASLSPISASARA